MSASIARWLVWAVLSCALATALAVGLTLVHDRPSGAASVAGAAAALVVGVAYPAAGALVLSRQHREPAGWLLLGLGLCTTITLVGGLLAFPALLTVIDLVVIGVGGACCGLLVLRLRRAGDLERQQSKWLAYAGSLLVVGFVIWLCASVSGQAVLADLVLDLTLLVAALGVPVAAGFALLRYHPYAIDVVIAQTLVIGALAAFITATYVAIVVGLGWLLGLGTRSELVLSLLATAVVALAFQPVRTQAQGAANGLVYGERASPYGVLKRFSRLAAGSADGDEILQQTARVVAEGVGAVQAQVWMSTDQGLVRVAAWPAQPSSSAPQPAGWEGPLPGADWSAPVRQHGELLGSLAVTLPQGQQLNRVELTLLRDLAAQTAVVLRNLRLTAALRARLDEIAKQEIELRHSRRQVVAAQDGERQRLERNIHDGAQQHLVALAVTLRLAENLATGAPDRALELAAVAKGQTGQALATLDELAHDVYPPLLAERGLGPALRAQAGRMTVKVEVVELSTVRAGPAAEYAAYLCCLEALQNAAKHSGADRVVVRLGADDRDLWFTVSDNGVGLEGPAGTAGTGLRNMRDRAESVGGRLHVGGAPGTGVTVRGAVPRAAAGAPG